MNDKKHNHYKKTPKIYHTCHQKKTNDKTKKIQPTYKKRKK